MISCCYKQQLSRNRRINSVAEGGRTYEFAESKLPNQGAQLLLLHEHEDVCTK